MYKVLKVCLCPSQDVIYFRPGIVITYFMPCGSHLFLELFAYAKQANTHINIHHDLKDVKLWQVRIPPPSLFLKQLNLMSMNFL